MVKKRLKRQLILRSVFFFFMLAIISCTAVVVDAFYDERNRVLSKRSEIEKNEQVVMSIESNLMGNDMDMVISDLIFLSEVLISDLTDLQPQSSSYKTWISFAENHYYYDNIRFIDKDGNEIFKIKQFFNRPTFVDEKQLTRKNYELSFKKTVGLPENNIYVSPIPVLMPGLSQIAPSLSITLSMPIYIKNTRVGIIAIDYNINKLLNEFLGIANNSNGIVYFVNAQGRYVIVNDPNDDRQSLLQNKGFIEFSIDFTDEWRKMNGIVNPIETENGLFTYSDITSDQWLTYDNGIEHKYKVVFGDEKWRMISQIKDDGKNAQYINIQVKDIIIDVITNKTVLFVHMILGSLLAACLIYLNAKRIQKIKYFSEYDTLTGVFNRRAGFDKFQKDLQSSLNSNSNLCICFSDIDGLKVINDTLGHEKGDELITTFVKCINSKIDHADYIIRMGGDEFIIIFVGATVQQAEATWSRIMHSFKQINELENRPYNISASHGIIKADIDDADKIICIADEKMYQEKSVNIQTFCAIKEKNRVK